MLCQGPLDKLDQADDATRSACSEQDTSQLLELTGEDSPQHARLAERIVVIEAAETPNA